MSAPLAQGGGFSLFPNTSRPPSRTQHHQHQNVAGDGSPPQPAVADVPNRCGTAFSDANTLVRSNSARSRSSIAKIPLFDDPPPGESSSNTTATGPSAGATATETGTGSNSRQPHRPPALQSIFPQYNPELPLDQQNYYPTQTSPTRIPRGAISRPLYSPASPQTTTSPQLNHHNHQSSIEEQVEQSYHQPQPQTRQPSQQHMTASAPAAAMPAAPAVVVSSPGRAPSSVYSPTAASVRASGQQQPMKLPVPSSNDELRRFWKVANGWKANPSEGRLYCLHMTCDKDAPIYRLVSATHQPFYRLRVDPTSLSSHVTLSRHDPAKPFKSESKGRRNSGGDGSSTNNNSSSTNNNNNATASEALGSNSNNSSSIDVSSVVSDRDAAALAKRMARCDASKNWQEALTTTLEEESRKRPPNDGLVALLYPTAAARMALQRPDDAAGVAMAERECCRLVWDDDSSSYFLVLPALALPFCVTVERNTTWSRTVYTLEHVESPQHLARLTREGGTGAGYLEVDTAIAAHIDAVYLVDVAVAALVLVAHADKQFAQVEVFAPPPAVLAGGGGGSMAGRNSSSSARNSLVNMVTGNGGRSTSRLSRYADGLIDSRSTKKQQQRRRMEEFDIESQTSGDVSGKAWEEGGLSFGPFRTSSSRTSKKAKSQQDKKEKLPFVIRVITALFKFCFWCLSLVVRAVLAIASCLFKCLTGEKLIA